MNLVIKNREDLENLRRLQNYKSRRTHWYNCKMIKAIYDRNHHEFLDSQNMANKWAEEFNKYFNSGKWMDSKREVA